MQIIYFTSALREDDFWEYNNKWNSTLNPSNQNFHYNLITSLAINNKVDVVSIRPFSKKVLSVKKLEKEKYKDGNITWHYLARRNKFDFYQYLYIKHKKHTVVLTDTLNIRILKLAKFYARTNLLPIIGICTDSPNNITSISNTLSKYLIRSGRHLGGYIALTEGLNNLYNKRGKPYVVINGVVRNIELKRENTHGKYILFAGSLLRKYGIYELIDAFNKIKEKDIKLLICGHTSEQDFQTKIYNNQNIVHLGCVTTKELYNLEKNSMMCVNPRPTNEQIDLLSFPSKILEYLNYSNLVLSTKNPIIEETFKNNIIWINSLKCEEFTKVLEFALDKDINEIVNNKNKVDKIIEEKYSQQSINKRLNEYLMSIIRK